jgi:hypothetical protein
VTARSADEADELRIALSNYLDKPWSRMHDWWGDVIAALGEPWTDFVADPDHPTTDPYQIGYSNGTAVVAVELEESRERAIRWAVTLEGECAEKDDEIERLHAALSHYTARAEAWFGAWECGCSDTETSPTRIPEFCPNHGRKLISSLAGQTKVQLNHSGVSGYGFEPGPAAALTGSTEDA